MNLLNITLTDFNKITLTVDDPSNFTVSNLKIKNGENILDVDNYFLCNNLINITLKNTVNIKYFTFVNYENVSSKLNYHTFFSTEAFNKKFFYNGILGCSYTPTCSKFKIWSPAAKSINLLLYKNDENKAYDIPKKIPLTEKKGLWSTVVNEDLNNYFYTYEITVYECTNEVVDPYAKAVSVNGLKGAIINLQNTNPTYWKLDKSPKNITNFTDAILYELNIRDITINPDSGVIHKGKFLGLCEENTKSSKNMPTGLSYIKSLGVTHVQIMPMFDFSFKSIDERNPVKYNWGYDPQNYNVPEGSYSTNPYSPSCRILELKEMIKTLHKNGLSVVMDVVFNHVFEAKESSFQKIFPGYYFRFYNNDTYSNGTGCGNDTASENKMMQKFIIDSVLYWAKEYHLDGFRFDLMGIHDVDTMNIIREQLDKFDRHILLYGEGWDLNTNLPQDKKAIISNSYKTPKVGYFNDVVRDILKGNVFFENETGFINGKPNLENIIKSCVTGCINYNDDIHGPFDSPQQSINYVSCHDNNTLWDKLNLTNRNDSEEDKKDMVKLALSIILTCQGIPFLQCGSEFCRTKNGIENSYNLPDNINWIDWNRYFCYNEVTNYCKNIIKMRKHHPAFRISDAETIKNNLEFLENTPNNMVAFILKDHANNDSWKNILIIYNANRTEQMLQLPQGFWNLVTDKHYSGETTIKTFENSINVQSTSIYILYQD